ncbi:hypothetical protein VTO42DRAFT_6305 [Malbranchea cinnamomea]
MATAEGPSRAHDRHGRRRPFANWMKRLANLKTSSDNSHKSSKRNGATAKGKKWPNSVYPLSGNVQDEAASRRNNGHLSFSEPSSTGRSANLSRSEPSFPESAYEQQPGAGRSAAPTLSTNADTTISEAATSKAGTSATVGGGTQGGGEGSTFSSPAPSVRSLTTTLTTVQSAAPTTHNHSSYHQHTSSSQQNGVQFSHQFPTTPISAVPPHLLPHPTTYVTATANNLLTDNASVLTLASSSKRRRRNSLDTNASIRALPPSSLFSGSRESLPLSVLSGNVAEPSNASITNASGIVGRSGIAGSNTNERGSVYSMADRGSIRSGWLSHHTRNDSTTGATGIQGRMSRRGSGWGEIPGNDDEDENENTQPRVTTTEYLDEKSNSDAELNRREKGRMQDS